ncbi:galactosylceramide sulfotransferase-like [Pollicipes pollicipes]|uniref:galactosylceramide sulfotransferase-like n=1 Tax=Pollicipes pollicipes TaxID=41117 RepID=UPI001884A297|nr:galactosylceramide sulfotransferase-like [Pollicipes pollicipes]
MFYKKPIAVKAIFCGIWLSGMVIVSQWYSTSVIWMTWLPTTRLVPPSASVTARLEPGAAKRPSDLCSAALANYTAGSSVMRFNIAFLKTHKCASTSVQNILFRFGERFNLSFVIPRRGHYFRTSHSMTGYKALPCHDPKCNIFAVHTRWNHSEISDLMPSDTVYVSMLREPVSQFKSLYDYVQLERFYGVDINEFVELPAGRRQERHHKFVGVNQMMWDFGLPSTGMRSEIAIRAKIDQITAEFDLIMLVERFEESLILLKDLMHWGTREVTYLRLNAARDQNASHLKPTTKERLHHILLADRMLYQHFAGVFDARVRAFGVERMAAEVAQLRAANAALEASCADRPTEDCCLNRHRGEALYVDRLRIRERALRDLDQRSVP